MAPPGTPNTTSTPCSSRDLITDSAPVTFIFPPSVAWFRRNKKHLELRGWRAQAYAGPRRLMNKYEGLRKRARSGRLLHRKERVYAGNRACQPGRIPRARLRTDDPIRLPGK